MLKITFVSVLVALAAACAAPEGGRTLQTPAALQAEPVVAHLVLGGVT